METANEAEVVRHGSDQCGERMSGSSRETSQVLPATAMGVSASF